MLGTPRTVQVVLTWSIATVVLTVAERAVAVAHGVSTSPLSWSARLAMVGLHAVLVAAAAVVVVLVGRIALKGRPRTGSTVAAVVCAIPFAVAGQVLAGGQWISRQWFAPGIAWGPILVGGALGVLTVRHAWGRGPRTTAVLAVIAASMIVVDATVAVGHHPAMHLLAWGVAVMATFIATLRLIVRTDVRRDVAWLSCLAIVISGTLGWWPSRSSTRAELLLRSPLAREILRASGRSPTSRLYAELADLRRAPATNEPVPAASRLPISPEVSTGECGSDESRSRQCRGAPRVNVLLVTIDALRADALPPVRTGRAVHAREGDTPHIDAFVASAFAFRHAYAPASYTMRSLPAIFRSRPPFEDFETPSLSLPEAMTRSGRATLAVVDRYFIEEPEGRALVPAFELLDVHATADMREGVDQVLALVDETGERPFFAWMHLLATHAPGYAGRKLGRRDGNWPQRYRKSVRWVDEEIGRLLAGLETRGLRDTTIVIIASDHGEGLGDNGIELHGESVFEEEVRVPMLIGIPGTTGAVIDATVSLVDLLPTLLHALDLPPDARHVGHSWLPLVVDPETPWPYDVFTMSRRKSYALIRDRDKLVYDAATDTLMRFDLLDDPTEEHDRFGDDPERDAPLVSALVRAHPALFAAELADPRTRALLHQHLRDVDFAARDETLPFLLQLIALAPDPELVDAALSNFARSDDATRTTIVEHLLPVAPEATGDAIVAYLQTVAGTAREGDFASALARASTAAFAPEQVAARLRWWADHGSFEDVTPWLKLVQPWPSKSWRDFGPSLTALSTRENAPAETVRLVLAAAEGLEPSDPEPMRPLADAARHHLRHHDAAVRTAACTALTRLATSRDLPALRQAITRSSEDIRVRQTCLRAVAQAGGDEAVDVLIEQAGDPHLTYYAIRLLETLRSPRAIPFLEETIATEKRGRIHAAASRALRLTHDDSNPVQRSAE